MAVSAPVEEAEKLGVDVSRFEQNDSKSAMLQAHRKRRVAGKFGVLEDLILYVRIVFWTERENTSLREAARVFEPLRISRSKN